MTNKFINDIIIFALNKKLFKVKFCSLAKK